MYIKMKEVRIAASDPSQRNKPFGDGGKGFPVGEKIAKNDPVGLEVFASRPYARDEFLNHFDRN